MTQKTDGTPRAYYLKRTRGFNPVSRDHLACALASLRLSSRRCLVAEDDWILTPSWPRD
jgi:hypothetical protein